MTSRRLMRYQSTQGLAEGVAHRLVQTIVRIQAAQERIDLCPVSYTHLTLPTSDLV